MWMHNTQTQGGRDGRVHTGSTVIEDRLAEGSAAHVIRNHHTFYEHLRNNCREDEEKLCVLYDKTPTYTQEDMQDQSNGDSNGKGDRCSTEGEDSVPTGGVLVRLFEVRQATVKQIWATRGQLFQRDVPWKMAEVCVSGNKTIFKPSLQRKCFFVCI